MTAAVAIAAGQALRHYRSKPARPRRTSPDSTALLLSGGGNLGFFHVGVIKVLRQAGILPRVLTGASAGATMAALIATRPERELRRLEHDELGFIGFEERQPERYTADDLEQALARVLPDVTFAEAEEISGRALNISLAGRDGGGVVCGPRSTPDVLVRDAVKASCAVPFVFEPVVVRERRNGRVTRFRRGAAWIDGSFFADVPTGFVKNRYGVRHAIVSLVNPAVRPFVSDRGRGRVRSLAMGAARHAALGFAQLGKLAAGALPRTRAMFDTACRVIEQSYDGDLVLTPSKRFAFGDVMETPSSELVRALSADGVARTRERLADLRAMGGLRLVAA